MWKVNHTAGRLSSPSLYALLRVKAHKSALLREERKSAGARAPCPTTAPDEPSAQNADDVGDHACPSPSAYRFTFSAVRRYRRMLPTRACAFLFFLQPGFLGARTGTDGREELACVSSSGVFDLRNKADGDGRTIEELFYFAGQSGSWKERTSCIGEKF